MNNLRFTLSLGVFLSMLMAATLTCANPVINFEETRHAFGDFKEESGIVEHTFHFTNEGNEPVQIYDVDPACGCTSPGWTRDPVEPGETGYVKAAYDPNGRPGKFNTSVRVETNDPRRETILLRISGNVIARERPISETHPHSFGSLVSRTPNFYIGKFDDAVTHGEGTFSFYNNGEHPVTLSKLDAPDYIELLNGPVTIEPGDEGLLRVKYDAQAKGAYGYVYDEVTLHTDDPHGAAKAFKISSQIVAHQSTSDEGTPELSFERTSFHFGDIASGDKPETAFKFTNTGDKPLEILRVFPSCGCTASEPDKSKLEPGESSHIKVSFDSSNRRGHNAQSVKVYSNDPADPVRELRISANVVSK